MLRKDCTEEFVALNIALSILRSSYYERGALPQPMCRHVYALSDELKELLSELSEKVTESVLEMP